jgi:Tfp pilus assembly protein PilF
MTGVYVDNHDVDKAADVLKALIKEEPESATYHNDLGFIWADHDKNLEESEKLIRKALELDEKARKKAFEEGKIDRDAADKKNAAYLDSLGWVLFKNKKYAEAKKVLLEAIKDDDEGAHMEIWDHLADVHVALGEQKEAIDIWLKALKFDDLTKRDAERRKKITEKLRKARAELKSKEPAKDQ